MYLRLKLMRSLFCVLGKKRKKASNESKKKKLKLPSAPFRLSEEDIRKADFRATNVSVPSGYGWQPKPFFVKWTLHQIS